MSNSSSSTLSNMLSMGGFDGRKGKRPHGVQGSPSPQNVHHSFSKLRPMLKHGGGHIALHYEHRKGR
jgi:hypothetical protein